MHAGKVISLSVSAEHGFSKQLCEAVTVVEGLGIEGDAHAGETVKHRSRVRADPTQPKLRQVHLIHSELLEELAASGFVVKPGDLGENILTEAVPLLDLPRHSILSIGNDVELEVTGLRNPCQQIENFMPGLLGQVLKKRDDGTLERKSGVMTVVHRSGVIRLGDEIRITYPEGEWLPLERV